MAERNYGHLLANAFGALKGKKARAAEPEDTTDSHEGEEHHPPEDNKEDGKKGKKAKKAGRKAGEGSEDDEEEETESETGESDESEETSREEEEDDEEDKLDKKRGKKGKKMSASAVIAAERVRIRRILSSDAALQSPKAAMVLALETSMPSSEAIAFLSIQADNNGGKSKRLLIDERMSHASSPNVGIEQPGAGADASAGNLSIESMGKMTAEQKGKLISAAGMIRRGEASNIQEGLKKLG